MRNRTETVTEKIKTDFGSLHVHVSFADGKPVDIDFSHQKRTDDTAIERLLDQIVDSVEEIINEVSVREVESGTETAPGGTLA